jgi:hypothetical protein
MWQAVHIFSIFHMHFVLRYSMLLLTLNFLISLYPLIVTVYDDIFIISFATHGLLPRPTETLFFKCTVQSVQNNTIEKKFVCSIMEFFIEDVIVDNEEVRYLKFFFKSSRILG